MFDKEGDFLRKNWQPGRKWRTITCKFPLGVVYLNTLHDNEIMIADHGNHRKRQVDVQTETVVKAFEENLRQQKESMTARLIFAWMNSKTLL